MLPADTRKLELSGAVSSLLKEKVDIDVEATLFQKNFKRLNYIRYVTMRVYIILFILYYYIINVRV